MTCSPVYGHGHGCNGTCGLEQNIDVNTDTDVTTSDGERAELVIRTE